MRIYLKLSKNTEIVPFAYQRKLVGALHKWLGENIEHDKLSMYSLSWLRGGKGDLKGLNFSRGADWFISAYDVDFIKKAVNGIMDDPHIAFGMKVVEMTLSEADNFGNMRRFNVGSPVFVKRSIENRQRHYTFDEIEADTLMTETLKNKLSKMGLEVEGVSVRFDRGYLKAKTTVATYGDIKNKANYCPVIIEGSPEQIGFAWDVGIGNSTGIAFGALI